MKYVIGIDLGTTNSCLSYVNTETENLVVHQLRIPQLTESGFVEFFPTLPSFCYLPAANELTEGSLKLPWNSNLEYGIGRFARDYGSQVPTRLVASAKSWLSHSAANRKEKILPFEAADESIRISPVEATARYLRHLRDSWNYQMALGIPENEFDQQEVIVTVPASFDEVARALTAEAAKMAGYQNMTFLEEPQAAFYSWIAQHKNNWNNIVKEGDTIIVCDVGGGTTDFSLIEVTTNQGELSFQRMAVGNHLLLGGDNMDNAIAYFFEQKIKGRYKKELNLLQWLQLKHESRKLKERILSSDDPIGKVLIQGTGSGVIKGTITSEANRQEIVDLLLTGFFAASSWDESIQIEKTGGIRTMGLPYENEASICKHLAGFIARSGESAKAPTFLLFNGGAMKPELFQNSIADAIENWFPGHRPAILASSSLDLAVSRGAAYFGMVRRGLGVRIKSGSPRSYYLEIDTLDKARKREVKALTLLARGAEEGASMESNYPFKVLPNTPVSFQILTSNVRLHDKESEICAIEPLEFHALPTIQTILRFGKKTPENNEPLPVKLGIKYTELGTLELWLQSLQTEHLWSLEFQVRNVSGQENSLQNSEGRSDETFDKAFLQNAENYLENYFKGNEKPEKMMEKLEEHLQLSRKDWPLSLLRGLFDRLIKLSVFRKKSSHLESRWWNLAGFLLRPGNRFPLDDHRIKEIWKIILADYKTPGSPEIQIQHWICYRRIACGLNKGQQIQLANEILTLVLNKKTGIIEIKNKKEVYSYSEKIRVLGSFELLENNTKALIGKALIRRMEKQEAVPADFWTLGRIGARHLAYGAINNVISKEICSEWLERLLKSKLPSDGDLFFVFSQLARKTNQREIDIPLSLVDQIISYFADTPFTERIKTLLLSGEHLSETEQEFLFGEKLPSGLILEI